MFYFYYIITSYTEKGIFVAFLKKAFFSPHKKAWREIGLVFPIYFVLLVTPTSIGTTNPSSVLSYI